MTMFDTETGGPPAAPAPVTRAKLLVESRHLLAAFETVGPCVPRRTPKDVLKSVLLRTEKGGATTLTATDMARAVRVTIPTPTADDDVSVLLPYEKFKEILTSTEGSEASLELVVEGPRLTVRGRRFRFDLPTLEPDTFPKVPEPPENAGWHAVKAADLRAMIARTRDAVDTKSLTYAMGGALVEALPDRLALVCTDGRRVAKAEAPAELIRGGALALAAASRKKKDQEARPIIPVGTLELLEKALPADDTAVAEISVDVEKAAFVRGGDVRVYTALVQGRFPRYDVVFGHEPQAELRFQVRQLLDLVNVASVTTSELSRGLNFTLAAGTLNVQARTADVGDGETETDVEYDGEDLKWCLDARYLKETLRSLPGSLDVVLAVTSDRLPVIIATDPNGDEGEAKRPVSVAILPITSADAVSGPPS